MRMAPDVMSGLRSTGPAPVEGNSAVVVVMPTPSTDAIQALLCCDARATPRGLPHRMASQHVDGNPEGPLPHGAMSPRRAGHHVIAFGEKDQPGHGAFRWDPPFLAGRCRPPAPGASQQLRCVDT